MGKSAGSGGRMTRAGFMAARAKLVKQAADAKRAGDNEGKRRAIAAMNELDTRFREMPAARRRATAWNQFVESGEAARRLGGRRR